MGYEGILETAYNRFIDDVIKNEGRVTIENIARFQKFLQNNKYDSSVLFMGANGSAKSYSALALAKYSDPDIIREGRILYSYDKVQKFIRLLADEKNRGKTIMIDELKQFFNYKDSMTYAQKRLMDMIEFARENNIALVGCANDIRRINNNYRNSKVQMVVYLLDRYSDTNLYIGDYQVKAYGAVLLGNPSIESEDKFCLGWLKNVYSFYSLKKQLESLPTFYGYFFMEDVSKYLTEEDIAIYKKNKNEGIVVRAMNMIEQLDARESKLEAEIESKKEFETNESFLNNLWSKFRLNNK